MATGNETHRELLTIPVLSRPAVDIETTGSYQPDYQWHFSRAEA